MPAMTLSIHSRIGDRDLEARVELAELLELRVEVSASFGKSATNRRISLTSGVSVSARNSTKAAIATT